MRRDVAQQLWFDNATDLAAAVAVPGLLLLLCGITALIGLDQSAQVDDAPYPLSSASLFCFVITVCALANTLLAAKVQQAHAGRVLQRHAERLRLHLREPHLPRVEMWYALPGGSAATLADSPARVVRDLGLRFGIWSRVLREDSAPLALRLPKVAFNTLVVALWVLGPLAMPNINPPQPSLLPAGILLWTLCGYLSFNMGYRIGVRRALYANLALLGVATAPAGSRHDL
jgi:hypothetical protein